MSMRLAPLRDAVQCPSEAVSRRSHLDHPLARLEGFRPVDGEAEEVEGARLVGPIFATTRTPHPVRSLEGDPTRLVRVQHQAVLAESLRQHAHHAARVLLELEQHDGVVCIAHKMSTSAKPRAHFVGEPYIEQRVQEDVRKNGRYDPALRTTRLRTRHRASFEYSCVEPLAYQALYHSVAYPAVQYLAQSLVVDRVEVLAYVDLDDPTAGHHRRLSMQYVQRLKRRASWPEAERAVQKVLLVNGLQHHRDRALQHLILEGRDAQRAHLATVFRDVRTPHWRRPVRAGLRAFE